MAGARVLTDAAELQLKQSPGEEATMVGGLDERHDISITEAWKSW
jgi:hypothetical protein